MRGRRAQALRPEAGRARIRLTANKAAMSGHADHPPQLTFYGSNGLR